MNTKYLAVVAALAVMLVAATAFATTDSVFAGGHGHKKKGGYEKNQAVAQANACGNGFYPENVWCQNTASQIQGEDNSERFLVHKVTKDMVAATAAVTVAATAAAEGNGYSD